MGALYARKVYVCACGMTEDAPFEQDLLHWVDRLGGAPLTRPRPWAAKVERIVLLAAMNRGWSISHHLATRNALRWRIGVAVGYLVRMTRGRFPIIFTIRRGARFITQLRIQWVLMKRRAATSPGSRRALTIQLLGSIDDMVSPDDNVDLVAGRDFIYLDVPMSGHGNVRIMDDSPAGQERRRVFEEALTLSREELEDIQVLPADVMTEERPDVKHVVFVVHGIRDEGYWTRKIARRVIQEGRDLGLVVASETSTYGYFPMLPFLWPGSRRAKVEWLMDRYAEALSLYPQAKFSYVGHSNGTYLLARALREYPSCRFENVVFAGSVVRREYDWRKMMPRQVSAVLNLVASADWVVAFFPKALQQMRLQDLGSAGHDGFKDTAVRQLPDYIRGGHGAGLREEVWSSIARFALSGNFEPPPSSTRSSEQAGWVAYPGKVPALIWVVIVGGLVYGLFRLLGLPVGEWEKTLIVVVYLTLIWNVLTRI